MAAVRTGDEIREAFLRYFEGQDHLRMPAASLIPAGDPTLLLTNAGMTQFKAYFSGESAPPHPRVTTAQKCFRTTDIDEVGDATHLTMFEMLGNFSFGDYFKAEACKWGLELMEKVYGFPRERLYATVYEDDEEAEQVWLDLGFPPERIYRFGDDENWWGPAGAEGPCGPCSELHYYSGSMDDVPPLGSPARENWGPNLTDDFVEIYNMVFTQFYRDLDGNDTPLPKKNIDTGLGLERAAAALQGVSSVYETDLFLPLIVKAEALSGKEWGESPEVDRALGVVAEHARSAAFLIGDGVVPGNTGRGYVLRRIIRRAMRFGLQIGLESPFLGELAGVAIDTMSHVYPVLAQNRPFILRVFEIEEEKFSHTVDTGSQLLKSLIDGRQRIVESLRSLAASPPVWDRLSTEEALAEARRLIEPLYHEPHLNVPATLLDRALRESAARPGATTGSLAGTWSSFLGADWEHGITGYESFLLYDTYGFPLEVTREIAGELGLEVDEEGYEEQMEAQRERGRASAQAFGGDAAARRVYESLGIDGTPFLGYETLTADTVVLAIIKDGETVQQAAEGEEVEVICRETPFYAEKGGQVGDRGLLEGPDGRGDVLDTQNPYAAINSHLVRVTEGEIKAGDSVRLAVDEDRRERIRRNHTATHLLHSALRQVLGTHVRQAGSLVAPDRLRFDFTHVSAMTPEELREVEDLVNDKIRANVPVNVRVTTQTKALEEGAIAFFGDKYGHDVRTISIDDDWSFELCGGTHMHATGGIGAFFITAEFSIGSGLRRIEALTGKGAEEFLRERFGLLQRLSERLRVPMTELDTRVEAQVRELEEARRNVARLERQALLGETARGGPERQVVHRIARLIEERGHDVGRPVAVATEVKIGSAVADLVAEVDGVRVLIELKTGAGAADLRQVGDHYRDQLGSGIVMLGSVVDDRPTVVAMVTKDLVKHGYNAGDIVREVAQRMGGGGGGRADVAQAGGRDASQMEAALAAVPEIIRAVKA